MGNPLLDISATVNAEFLAKYGLDANNAILAEDKHQPIYADVVKDFEVEYIAGGATQNSIRVAQWMLGSPATAYMGSVGKDEYADTLKAKASEGGTNVVYQVDESVPAGTCAVLITGNDRSLVANISAANNYKESHLDANMAVVESAQIYYISGFFLTVSPPSIMKVGAHAAANNKIFTMNLAAPFICQFFKDPLMAALPYVDILFGNETEYADFAKANLGESFAYGATLGDVAKTVAELPKENAERKRIVVVTQGAEPTLIYADGELKEYPIVACTSEEIIDTNGAGDAWVGGFLAALAKGKSIEECTKAAGYAAKVVICRSGCTYPEKPDYTL
jgi:adenosine kinase